MTGIEQTAKLSISKLSQVMELKQGIEKDIHKNWGRRTESGIALPKELFRNPAVRVKDVEKICSLNKRPQEIMLKRLSKVKSRGSA